MRAFVRIAILGTVAASCSAAPAQAEISPREYLQRLRLEPSLRSYLDGMATGMDWLNTRVETRGGQPVYCPPKNLAITAEQHIDILERYLKQGRPDEWDQPLGLVLIKALAKTFPCQ
jgi:hypothetical protein